MSLVVNRLGLALATAILITPAVLAQDGWSTIPKSGDADPFRPGEKAGPIPRTRDGKPDLSGIWQGRTLADWNIIRHRADYGAPGGPGIVEGDKIPYQEWALKKRADLAKSLLNDPQSNPSTRCQLPGVPRITYMPYAFEIVQTPAAIHAIYEYQHAWRTLRMDGSPHTSGSESYDGDSLAHWDGDTLVVDVRGLNGQTWLDMAGDFHSDQLHVVERYTPIDSNILLYEATLEDPKVYTAPWKLRLPLYRQTRNFELLEYECEEDASVSSNAAGQLSGSPQ